MAFWGFVSCANLIASIQLFTYIQDTKTKVALLRLDLEETDTCLKNVKQTLIDHDSINNTGTPFKHPVFDV